MELYCYADLVLFAIFVAIIFLNARIKQIHSLTSVIWVKVES